MKNDVSIQQLSNDQAKESPQSQSDRASCYAPIPQCSTWFSLETVNPIEERSLPEFFQFKPGPLHSSSILGTATNSKSPTLYIKYRNFMVNAYRKEPSIYLTATACRRNLAGDACAILRVHEFLTYWGLINFDVPPHETPCFVPVPILSCNKVRSTTQNDSMNGGCEICGYGAIVYRPTAEAKAKISPLLSTKDTLATCVTEDPISSQDMNTNVTRYLSEGLSGRYTCGICEECFDHNRYSDKLDASEFVRLRTESKWTVEETDRLYHALNNVADDADSCDWNEIATQVKTKSAQECLFQFLQLPSSERAATVSPAVNILLDASNESNGSNPTAVMEAETGSIHVLASIAAQVDPLVATEASKAALNAICRLQKLPIDQSYCNLAQLKEPDNSACNTKLMPADVLHEASTAVYEAARLSGLSSEPLIDEVPKFYTETTEKKGLKQECGLQTSSVVEFSESARDRSKEFLSAEGEAAAATGMAVLTLRANGILRNNDADIKELLGELIDNQLDQMRLKMQQLDVLEKNLRLDREQFARERYQLYTERLAFSISKISNANIGA